MTMLPRRTIVVLVSLAVVACASVIAAAPGPAAQALTDDAPVSVRADRLDLDLDGKNAVLDGKVELRRGDLLLRCPQLRARFDTQPQITWAHASGGVQLEANQTQAEASEATVDLVKKQVVLRGAVVLRRAGSVLRAESASLDLETRRVSLSAVSGSIALPAAPKALPPPSASAP